MLQKTVVDNRGFNSFIRVFASFLYQMQTRRTTQKTNFLGYKRLNWGGGLGKIWGPGCSKNKEGGGGGWLADTKE